VLGTRIKPAVRRDSLVTGGSVQIRIAYAVGIEVKGIDGEGFLEVKENTTVKKLLKRLDLEKGQRKHLPVIVNGRLVKRSYRLQEEDEVTFFLPAAGG
jgi:sulfur carrier protein ThiS